MSVVACRVTDTEIRFAADSISVRGYTQDKKGTKLAQVKSGVVIAGCGRAETTALFFQFASTRTPAEPTTESVGRYLADFHAWFRKTTENASRDVDDNSFMIAFDGHAFFAHGYYVSEVKDFEAIGAGMDYALAALYLGSTPEKACETAIELSIYCEGPVQSLAIAKAVTYP